MSVICASEVILLSVGQAAMKKMLVSVASTATRDHAEVYDQC